MLMPAATTLMAFMESHRVMPASYTVGTDAPLRTPSSQASPSKEKDSKSRSASSDESSLSEPEQVVSKDILRLRRIARGQNKNAFVVMSPRATIGWIFSILLWVRGPKGYCTSL